MSQPLPVYLHRQKASLSTIWMALKELPWLGMVWVSAAIFCTFWNFTGGTVRDLAKRKASGLQVSIPEFGSRKFPRKSERNFTFRVGAKIISQRYTETNSHAEIFKMRLLGHSSFAGSLNLFTVLSICANQPIKDLIPFFLQQLVKHSVKTRASLASSSCLLQR